MLCDYTQTITVLANFKSSKNQRKKLKSLKFNTFFRFSWDAKNAGQL